MHQTGRCLGRPNPDGVPGNQQYSPVYRDDSCLVGAAPGAENAALVGVRLRGGAGAVEASISVQEEQIAVATTLDGD